MLDDLSELSIMLLIMDHQLDMLNPEPTPTIARRSDPVTSKMAALKYKKKFKTQCDLMRTLIRDFPGKTRNEYTEILKGRGYGAMEAHRIPNKRVSDLKKAGELIVGAARKCTVSGYKCEIYFLNPDYL